MPRDLLADKPKAAPRDLLADSGPAYSGGFLPFSRDADGNVSFDSNAGILGAAKRAFTLPHDVMTGDVPIFDPQTGHVSDEAIRRSTEAAPFYSPITPAARNAPARTLAGKKVRDVPEPPSRERLLETGSAQFEKGRKLGVKFEPAYVNELGRQAEARLTQEGFDPTNAPKTFAVLKDMQQPAERGAFAAYDDILKIRSRLKKARMDFNNPADKSAAERLVLVVEGFVGGAPGTGAVRSGPAEALANVHKDALGNYAAAKRSADLGNLERNAIRRARASNSGQNIGNTIRQRAASLLESPKKLKGYSEEEIAALEQVAAGTATQNTLRYVGNLLGGGGGLGGAVTAGGVAGAAGYAAGGPFGAALATGGTAAAGIGSKRASNALTLKAMRGVDKMTRMRSPLYEQMISSAEWKTANSAKRSAMLKALLATIENDRQSAQ